MIYVKEKSFKYCHILILLLAYTDKCMSYHLSCQTVIKNRRYTKIFAAYTYN